VAADDDYDDTIGVIVPEPTALVLAEWQELCASIEFAAFMRLVLRGARRVRKTPNENHTIADTIFQLAYKRPELIGRYEEVVFKVTDWLRDGAQPLPPGLTLTQRVTRREALAERRLRRSGAR